MERDPVPSPITGPVRGWRETDFMQSDTGTPVRARIFITTVSAVLAAMVGGAVVKGIGYPVTLGLLYAGGYFIAMILLFNAFGYTLFGGSNE